MYYYINNSNSLLKDYRLNGIYYTIRILSVDSAGTTVTWDQAQFERFSRILSNGYRWNWAWYKLIHVCARYGQILAVTLIGC